MQIKRREKNVEWSENVICANVANCLFYTGVVGAFFLICLCIQRFISKVKWVTSNMEELQFHPAPSRLTLLIPNKLYRLGNVILLPPAYVVYGTAMFSVVSVCSLGHWDSLPLPVDLFNMFTWDHPLPLPDGVQTSLYIICQAGGLLSCCYYVYYIALSRQILPFKMLKWYSSNYWPFILQQQSVSNLTIFNWIIKIFNLMWWYYTFFFLTCYLIFLYCYFFK